MTRARPISETITLHVPFRIVKRGGRKEMVLPPHATARAEIDGTIVKALARAFRWKKLLESGEFATIRDLAKYERIAPTYMTRLMRLTLLAPGIVDAILAGPGDRVGLAQLLEPFPADWTKQTHRRICHHEIQSGISSD